MSDDENQLPPQDIEQALDKLHLKDVNWARPIMPSDILYLLDHCPFLQIVNTNATPPLEEVELITAKTNWVIHYYGDAMSSSPGKFLFAGGNFRILLNDEDDGGDGGIVNPGKGTIWKQAFDTAQEMMALAKKLGWGGVKIIDGHPLMQWAAWMYAEDKGVHLEGYQPTQEDKARRQRVKRSDIDDQSQVYVRPVPQ